MKSYKLTSYSPFKEDIVLTLLSITVDILHFSYIFVHIFLITQIALST